MNLTRREFVASSAAAIATAPHVRKSDECSSRPSIDQLFGLLDGDGFGIEDLPLYLQKRILGTSVDDIRESRMNDSNSVHVLQELITESDWYVRRLIIQELISNRYPYDASPSMDLLEVFR